MSSEPMNFTEFWPYYLGEHRSRRCRSLHYLGSALAITTALCIVCTGNYTWLMISALCGYGPAWLGHFFFEKNKPATFKYPLYSLVADWTMCFRALSGKLLEDFEKFGIPTTR